MPPPFPGIDTYRLATGDVLSRLRLMPDQCVHSVTCSPPYYGLRDYGTEAQVWGGSSDCSHAFDDAGCCECTAWRGELGHEPTPDMFVRHLVEIFREVRRVLRDDGTAFINLGDSYNHGNRTIVRSKKLPPEKNMLAVPWKLGLALQADGWTLRQDVIWAKSGGNCPKCHYRLHKGSAMPEPVRDRFVRAHEYVLFLSKKPKNYYFDYVGIQQSGANRRDVLFLTSTPYRFSATAEDGTEEKRHYAIMSEHLAEVCVLAGTPLKACRSCGSPWKRVVRGKKETKAERMSRLKEPNARVAPRHDGGALQQGIHIGAFPKETLGWKATCTCDAEAIPGIVLDPFSGTGTTGVVALRNGRRYYGIDIDPAMMPVATSRLDAEILSRAEVGDIAWLTDDDGLCIAQ